MDTLAQGNNYPKDIPNIPKEFEATADVLYLASKAFLDNLPEHKELVKSWRLANLGFHKAQRVELTNAERKEIDFAKRVEYYRFTYPTNKFITDEQVDSICIKYGLILGNVDIYKGFVPEANLQAIERFKVIEGDAKKIAEYNPNVGEIKGRRDFITQEYKKEFISNDFCTREWINAPLVICAPLQFMDIDGKKIEESYKVLKTKPVPVLDPIVLQAVDYGYLIVTAWGNEASDEVVLNERHN